MGLSEAEFLAGLLVTFKVEADEHLQALSNGLLALEKEPEGQHSQEKLEEIFREVHNLKGAARAVSQESIESLCQAMENVLSSLKNHKLKLSRSLFDTLYASIDLITKAVANMNEKMEKSVIAEMVERLNQAQNGNAPTKPKIEEEEEAPKAVLESDKTIRVLSTKLDKLLQQVEEMLVVKLASGQKVHELKNLEKDIALLEKQWKRVQADTRLFKQNLPLMKHLTNKELDVLVQTFQFVDWHQEFLTGINEKLLALVTNTKQEHRLVTSMVDTLLEDTKQVLMQPFSTLLSSFPRMVRDISHALGKEILFETEGGDTDVDRRILEELKDPLTHIIRNAIDHGIEIPEERARAQKPPQGKIRIQVNQASGNKVTLLITDDGKGIDIDQVKKSALKQGLASQKDLEEMPDAQALRLIFQSGISTAQIISDLSGRGLGMGIVREKVEKLGGEIFLSTTKGKGSEFRIVLPITLATFRGIHIRASEHDFIVPTHHVARTFRTTFDNIKNMEGKPSVTVEGKPIAYIHLNDILNLPFQKQAGRYLYILVVHAGETQIAIGTDAIIDEQEVFVKSLGSHLTKVQHIAAATVLEGGKVVPILDPFDLVKTAVASNGGFKASAQKKEVSQTAKTILVAEDSVTARILLKNILSSSGYIVKTAVDGMEALAILKTEKADLLLTDVEMPRMTGFELTAKVREIEEFKNLPIIICTSLGSKEDKERGIEAGANAYIKKSSFTQSHLIDIVKQLL